METPRAFGCLVAPKSLVTVAHGEDYSCFHLIEHVLQILRLQELRRFASTLTNRPHKGLVVILHPRMYVLHVLSNLGLGLGFRVC